MLKALLLLLKSRTYGNALPSIGLFIHNDRYKQVSLTITKLQSGSRS
ncbi:hypothetical protein [Phormidesmis priestleyi]|nr:hypothetical protein [Phormidesmis priestleyi]